MKKVRFTLGMAFALLLGSANGIYGQVADTLSDIPVKVTVLPGDSVIQKFEFKHGFLGQSTIKGSTTFNKINYIEATKKGENYSVYGGLIDHVDIENSVKGDSKQYPPYIVSGSIEISAKDRQDFAPYTLIRRLTVKDTLESDGFTVIENSYIDSKIYPTSEKKESTKTTYSYYDDITALVKSYHVFKIEYLILVGVEYGEISTPPTINRYVKLEVADGLLTNPYADEDAYHYVNEDRSFKFTVYGEPGKDITVTSDKTDLNKSPIDVVSNLTTGVHQVTMVNITSNPTVKINYVTTTSAEPDGNAVIAADAIWGAGGTLQVKAASAGTLSIYNVTGQLVKQTSVAGNYTLSLPKGLYIVQLNGKAYKVIL